MPNQMRPLQIKQKQADTGVRVFFFLRSLRRRNQSVCPLTIMQVSEQLSRQILLSAHYQKRPTPRLWVELCRLCYNGLSQMRLSYDQTAPGTMAGRLVSTEHSDQVGS